MTQQFGDFQLEIYRDGTKGVLPRYPIDHAGLERKAAEALAPWILSYVAGGCGNEHTQRANVAAFEKWGIVPRMFNGSYERDLSIELFGMRLPTPLFTVPIGVIGVCSQDFHGDLQVARAAARTGVPVMQSTLSMDPMEDLVPAMGDTPGFFQLYTPKDRDLAVSLIQRAEAAGFKAIAVTLDTWVTGWRPRDLNAANFPQLRGYCLANYFTDEHFLRRLKKKPQDDVAAAAAEWANLFGYSLTWDDLKWIREATTLPVVASRSRRGRRGPGGGDPGQAPRPGTGAAHGRCCRRVRRASERVHRRRHLHPRLWPALRPESVGVPPDRARNAGCRAHNAGISAAPLA